jgi:hypothetical protein
MADQFNSQSALHFNGVPGVRPKQAKVCLTN